MDHACHVELDQAESMRPVNQLCGQQKNRYRPFARTVASQGTGQTHGRPIAPPTAITRLFNGGAQRRDRCAPTSRSQPNGPPGSPNSGRPARSERCFADIGRNEPARTDEPRSLRASGYPIAYHAVWQAMETSAIGRAESRADGPPALLAHRQSLPTTEDGIEL